MSDDGSIDGPPAGGDPPTKSTLPTPEPRVTPETEAYWAAASEGRLLIGYCPECAEHFFYPRAHCPRCGFGGAEFVEAEGTGTVYACSIVRQAGGAYGEATPYVLAWIELDEGPRMLSNVVGTDPEDVGIGDRVEVTFDPVGEDVALPRFRPV